MNKWLKISNILEDFFQSFENVLEKNLLVGAALYCVLFGVRRWLFPEDYDNLILRAISVLLLTIMVLHRYWPGYLKRLRGIFLFVLITYCLPFFFTFMTLKNRFSDSWKLSLLTSSFIILMLAPLRIAVFSISIGIIVAVCTFTTTNGYIQLRTLGEHYEILLILIFEIGLATYFINERIGPVRAALQEVEKSVERILHQLKSPIGLISIHLANALDMVWSNPNAAIAEIKECFKGIQRSSWWISNQRIKSALASEEPFENSIFSIRSTIDDAIREYPFLDESERERVKLFSSPDFLVAGSEQEIFAVMSNLLDNAIQSIREKGTQTAAISFETVPGDSLANQPVNIVVIKDNGVGIPKNQRKLVFQKYTSGRRGYGFGIGLYLCRKMMQRNDGSISLSSEVTEGATFILHFPAVTDLAQKSI